MIREENVSPFIIISHGSPISLSLSLLVVLLKMSKVSKKKISKDIFGCVVMMIYDDVFCVVAEQQCAFLCRRLSPHTHHDDILKTTVKMKTSS